MAVSANTTIASRRGLLRGLASLPLIGGSVAILGQPTKAAVPVTEDLLRRYGAFCWTELNQTTIALQKINGCHFSWNDFGREFIEPMLAMANPRRNAPIVLSAVGCPLTGGT